MGAGLVHGNETLIDQDQDQPVCANRRRRCFCLVHGGGVIGVKIDRADLSGASFFASAGHCKKYDGPYSLLSGVAVDISGSEVL